MVLICVVSVPSSSGLPSFHKQGELKGTIVEMSLSPLHRGFLPSEEVALKTIGELIVSVPSSSGLPSFPHRKYLNAINYLQVVLYNPRRNSFGHARYPGILVHTAVNRLLVAATQPGAYTLFARIPA